MFELAEKAGVSNLTTGAKDRIKKNINDSRVMEKYYKEK